jgi:hypothetical protein
MLKLGPRETGPELSLLPDPGMETGASSQGAPDIDRPPALAGTTLEERQTFCEEEERVVSGLRFPHPGRGSQ